MRTEDGEQISDHINMVVIELNKLGDMLKKPISEMTSLEMWSAFLGYADSPEQRGLINKMIEKKEALGMASTILMSISKDDHERAKFRSIKKYEMDMASNLLTAEARGERKGKIEMIQKLKATGNISIEEISLLSGFTVAEIENLI